MVPDAFPFFISCVRFKISPGTASCTNVVVAGQAKRVVNKMIRDVNFNIIFSFTAGAAIMTCLPGDLE